MYNESEFINMQITLYNPLLRKKDYTNNTINVSAFLLVGGFDQMSKFKI